MIASYGLAIYPLMAFAMLNIWGMVLYPSRRLVYFVLAISSGLWSVWLITELDTVVMP